MKTFITSFNKKLGVNPIVGRMFDAIPGVTRANPEGCDVVFYLFIAPDCDFVLDTETLERVKQRNAPIIVFDYTETYPMDFIIGRSMQDENNPYRAVYQWLFKANVRAYFKREFPNNENTKLYFSALNFPVYPVDWTLQDLPIPLVDTPQQFEDRPIDILMSFGYSNESRPRLMGELLRQSGRFSAHVCVTEDDVRIALAEGRKRIFALLFTPHFRRIPLGVLLSWQQQTKVSISMFGAGRKCFRSNEASYNCVMAQEGPGLVEWSYPWNASQNCIGLPNRLDEVGRAEELYVWLRKQQGGLHPMYLSGMANNQHYHNTAYARDYLLPRIQEALK